MNRIEKEAKGMNTYTLDEWRSKLRDSFGTQARDFKFVCPACGKVTSVAEFVEAGLSEDDACNAAYQECIGRYTGAGSPEKDKQPCNWAAYGLFGTLGNGAIVVTPEGKRIEVFAIAETEVQHGKH